MDASYLTAHSRHFGKGSQSHLCIYIWRHSQMPAGDGCFLVNPLKEDGRYDLFFFICYRYEIKFCNWVQNPSHQLWLSNTYPIKLCNARVNVLLHLNNQITDWRPVGQRLFFLWENVLYPGSSLIAVFHNAVVPHYSQTRVSAPFRPEHSPPALHVPGLT